MVKRGKNYISGKFAADQMYKTILEIEEKISNLIIRTNASDPSGLRDFDWTKEEAGIDDIKEQSTKSISKAYGDLHKPFKGYVELKSAKWIPREQMGESEVNYTGTMNVCFHYMAVIFTYSLEIKFEVNLEKNLVRVVEKGDAPKVVSFSEDKPYVIPRLIAKGAKKDWPIEEGSSFMGKGTLKKETNEALREKASSTCNVPQ
jgi:hypothetical protein